MSFQKLCVRTDFCITLFEGDWGGEDQWEYHNFLSLFITQERTHLFPTLVRIPISLGTLV